MSGPTFEERLLSLENDINKLLEECQKMADMNTASKFVNKSDTNVEGFHSSLVALESMVQRLKLKVAKIEKEQ